MPAVASAMFTSTRAHGPRRSCGSNAAWRSAGCGTFRSCCYLVSSTLGYAYVLAGRVSDALPLLEPSASTEGVGILPGRVHGWLSEAYLRLGRRDDALAVAERGLELCRTHAQQGEQAWALRFLGEIHA